MVGINKVYQKHGVTLYCGDMRDMMPTLPASSIDYIVTDPPYGFGFLEKKWDSETPGFVSWCPALDVCKPGASLLAFGGTRTYHRLTCAIEDAGWEIRDCLMWLQGQGMPKAGDIGKLIDKAKGPAPLAAKFTGWAASLKPSWEPIILATKSVDGTLAHDAERWGVAGLNIDACRISTAGETIHCPQSDPANRAGVVGTNLGFTKSDKGSFQAAQRESIRKTRELGRWPANLLLDEEAAATLDAQAGLRTSGMMKPGQKRHQGGGYHGNMPTEATATGTYGDSGGASRFFYCPKITKKERGEGNDHPTVKPLALMKWLLTLCSTPDGGLVLDPFAGSGSTLLAARALGRECIGVELDPHNCEIIVSRLENP